MSQHNQFATAGNLLVQQLVQYLYYTPTGLLLYYNVSIINLQLLVTFWSCICICAV